MQIAAGCSQRWLPFIAVIAEKHTVVVPMPGLREQA
jgi:hypothetical protein